MSNNVLSLSLLLESINKIKRYSSEFTNADDFYHHQMNFDASIKSFRNNIAHDYFGIDADEVWSVVTEHLDRFEQDIVDLLTALK